MESLYSRFHSYDFDKDDRFLEGLKKVNISDSNKELLKLKIFFYNRFVEPIDLPGFEEWEAKRRKVVADTSCTENDVGVDDVTSPARDATLSFSEVFRRIQAGEEIPGLHKLDIKPCNQPPTVSQMSRRQKPWEK